jgi:permuted papain-like amidase YaeF/Yiix C92 family enzyme
MAGWLRTKVFDMAARALTKPRDQYTLLLPNDFESLLRALRPGDVILVDGDQRISEVIKYLTQSTWSHSVLYVGEEILHRYPGQREALVATHGRDARHMIVEALMEGVVASPLAKYAQFNLRICRPTSLRRDDLQRVLDEVLAQLGVKYDVKNVVDLARYFFPVSLIPRRFRRRALQFGSGLPTQVICSSLIGRAFQNVGYPILPTTTPAPGPTRPRRLLDRLLYRTLPPYPALFRRQIPSIITPRDFDLSPYFEVIKFNPVETARFDYRRIRWEDGETRAAGGSRSGS